MTYWLSLRGFLCLSVRPSVCLYISYSSSSASSVCCLFLFAGCSLYACTYMCRVTMKTIVDRRLRRWFYFIFYYFDETFLFVSPTEAAAAASKSESAAKRQSNTNSERHTQRNNQRTDRPTNWLTNSINSSEPNRTDWRSSPESLFMYERLCLLGRRVCMCGSLHGCLDVGWFVGCLDGLVASWLVVTAEMLFFFFFCYCFHNNHHL